MNEVSVKKVLRTIKFSKKLDVSHQANPSPKCHLQPSFPRIQNPQEKHQISLMTDTTHKKTITFGSSQCFRSIKKSQTILEPLPKKINAAKECESVMSAITNITNKHTNHNNASNIDHSNNGESAFISILNTNSANKNNISSLSSKKKLVEEKPKKNKFMSKKKNLVITDFLQFEDERNENKENTGVLALDEAIKENLVNKHVLNKNNPPICPMTVTSLVRRTNMTPKYSATFVSKNIFNMPDLKMRKMPHHYEDYDYKIDKDINSNKNNAIFQLEENSNIISCCYDFEDYYIAFGSDDSFIRVYKTATQRLLCCFSDKENYGVPITCIKFKPIAIDNILMSARVNGTISLWNIEKNQMISSMKEDNYIYTCEYNREGSKFATAGYDTKIRLYDHEKFQQFSTLEKDEKNDDFLGHTNRIYSLKYRPDHPDILFSAGWDETLFQWDTRVGKHIDYIYGPLICGDSLDVRGNYILTGNWRNHHQLQIWDVRNKKVVEDINWEQFEPQKTPSNRNYIYVCQFNKNSDRFIVAGSTGDNEIRIFDKEEKYKCVDIVSGFEKPIYTLNFDHMEKKLAFGSGNGLCGVFEL